MKTCTLNENMERENAKSRTELRNGLEGVKWIFNERTKIYIDCEVPMGITCHKYVRRDDMMKYIYFHHVEFLQSILRCEIRQWRSAFRKIRSKHEIFGWVAIPPHRTHSLNFQLLLVSIFKGVMPLTSNLRNKTCSPQNLWEFLSRWKPSTAF